MTRRHLLTATLCLGILAGGVFQGCTTVKNVTERLAFWKDKEEEEQPTEEEVREMQRVQMVRSGKTELIVAVERNDLAEAARLLRENAPVNRADNSGKTPIHYAISECNIRMVQMLLKHEANVHVRDVANRTSLHFSAISNCNTVVPLLIARGLDVDARDKFGRTPLHLAAENHNAAVIQRLLERDANIHIRDHRGKSAIWLAADRVSFFDEEIVEEVDASQFRARRSDRWPVYLRVPAQTIADGFTNAVTQVRNFDFRTFTPWIPPEKPPNDIWTFQLLLEAGASLSDMDYSFISAYDILQSRGEPEILALIQNYR